MEYLPNGLTLEIPGTCFPLSTDSILLADFVRLSAQADVLDLGSGCATLGLLLCARDSNCTVTGIEIDPAAHAAAAENIRRNQLQHRLYSICADLREKNQLIQPGTFQICVSNPPYFSGGPASREHPSARQTELCSAEDLFQAASHALKYGGDFFLVHKPENLAHLCACAARFGLEPKRLRLVRHREGGPVSLILLSCRKGGKPGLIWEEISLHDRHNVPTPYYNDLYHLKTE